MKISKWRKLKIVENYENLEIGDNFLMGTSVEEQKETKVQGDKISYYKIIGKKERSVEYMAIYDTLEED